MKAGRHVITEGDVQARGGSGRFLGSLRPGGSHCAGRLLQADFFYIVHEGKCPPVGKEATCYSGCWALWTARAGPR